MVNDGAAAQPSRCDPSVPRTPGSALRVLGVEAAFCLLLGLAGGAARSFAPGVTWQLILFDLTTALVWWFTTLVRVIRAAMRRNGKRAAWLMAKHLVLLPSIVALALNGGAYVHLVLRLPDYLPEISAHPQARLLFPWSPVHSAFCWADRTLIYDAKPGDAPDRPHCQYDEVEHLVWHFYLVTGSNPAEPGR